MKTFSRIIEVENFQKEINDLEKEIFEASFTIKDKGNPYYERRYYRGISKFQDSIFKIDEQKFLFIRTVIFAN